MNNDYINIIFDRKTLVQLSNILSDYQSYIEFVVAPMFRIGANPLVMKEVETVRKIHVLIEERLDEKKE